MSSPQSDHEVEIRPPSDEPDDDVTTTPGKGKGKGKKSNYATKKDLTQLNEKLERLMELVPTIKKLQAAQEQKVRPTQRPSQIKPPQPDNDSDDDNEEGEVSEENSLNYFTEITEPPTKKGPKLIQGIADGTTRLLSKGMDSENKERIVKNYHTPENCPRLSLMSCNETIYRAMSKSVRVKDAGLQAISKNLTTSLTAATYAFNHIEAVKGMEEGMDAEDTRYISGMLADSMALMAETSHQLDLLRREGYRPELNKDYAKTLCDPKLPIEENLFGPDSELPERMKTASETRKMIDQVCKKTRFFPYQYKKPTSFLGPRTHPRQQQSTSRGGFNQQAQRSRTWYPSHQQTHQQNKNYRQRQDNQKMNKRK